MIVYRIAPTWNLSLDAVQATLQPASFLPCSATQEHSSGFVPPRGEEHGALLESVGGQWILRFMQESKMLPAQVVARKVQEKVQQIERATGRQPGKKERRDLKEEVKLDLLPQAFSRQGSMWVWIDPQAHFLVLDASSQSRADEVVSVLTALWPGFAVALLDTQTAPSTAMALWLKEQEAPAGFSIDRECELQSTDDSKAVVRYARHRLDIEEVRAHIDAGKMPTKLALTWDERMSFVLTQGLQLKKISFLDGVWNAQAQEEADFDARVALATGEWARLLPDVIAALDGEGRSAHMDQGQITGPAQAPVDSDPDSAPF